MKVLLCHNYYQLPGGEDLVFADEARLLESRGHQVVRFTEHNDRIKQLSRWGVARRTVWNGESYVRLRKLLRQQRPQVAHCHNTFPLISPAVYYAARAEGVPVVQSLHNYRLLCPNALFLRNGQKCEKCLGKSLAWPAVLYCCYRQSRVGSAVVTTMLGVHRIMRTWTRLVDRYVAMTDFARRKFVEGGLPREKIFVKPNFLASDPSPGTGGGGYALFAGRFSHEKGILTLLEAWSRLCRRIPLKIIGDGPLADRVEEVAAQNHNVQWLGQLPQEEVLSIVGEAGCLVFPSICYETFGRTIIEAFAKGTPVVASRMGAMAELVEDGRTGMLFDPGNPDDLARKVCQLLSDPTKLARMRRAARHEYQRKYTAELNYQKLMAIYQQESPVSYSQTTRPTTEHDESCPQETATRPGEAASQSSSRMLPV